MKILRVRVHNYGSFQGPHEFQLTGKGLVLVLGDNRDEPRMSSNGAAKSTLFEAIDWCEYGKVPKGDHTDSIVNETVGSDCWVEVDHEDDSGRKFTVRRWRKVQKTNGLQLTIDGEDVSALDTTETQKAIDSLLGMDRDVFHAAVFFAQTDMWNFADATDKERIGILTKILQLDQIDDWQTLAKEKRRTNQELIDKAHALVSGAQGRLEGIQSQNFDEKIRTWASTHEFKIQEKLSVVRIAEEALDGPAPDIAALEAEQHRIIATKPLAPDQSAVRAKASGLKLQHQALLGAVAADKARQRDAEEALVQVQNSTGTGDCSVCGQPITADHLEKEAAKLSEKASAYQETVMQAHHAAMSVETELAGLTKFIDDESAGYHRALNDHNQASIAIQQAISEARIAKTHADNAQLSLDRAKADLAQVRNEVNPFEALARDTQAEEAQCQSELATLQKQHADLLEADRYLDFWVTAFGPKGLKSYIIDSKLQQMSDAANQWIQMLTGGTVWIQFETQTMGRTSKTLSNKMNIRVFRWNTDGSTSERNYRSWSGGEKQRVSLGIDLGLAKLIAQRATKQYDLLIFDEVFKHLDQLGREAVVEALHTLSREKSSVFVIDHDQSFQGAFENKVLIRKERGASSIIEEGDYAEEKPKAKAGSGNIRSGANTKAKRRGRKPVTASS